MQHRIPARRGRLIAVGLFGLALTLSTAAAAQSSMGELKACTWIADETERLACFDRVTKKLQQSPAAKLPPSETAAPDRRPAPSTDRFGLPPQQAETVPEDPDRRRLVVAEVREAPFGQAIFVMQNGQVWRQTDSRRLGAVEPGTQVRVKKGWVGGYLMTVNGRTIRVKRAE